MNVFQLMFKAIRIFHSGAPEGPWRGFYEANDLLIS